MIERPYHFPFKERRNCRRMIERLCKENRYTLQEVMKMNLSKNLLNQAKKMEQEGYEPHLE